jgi:hypothetical protein
LGAFSLKKWVFVAIRMRPWCLFSITWGRFCLLFCCDLGGGEEAGAGMHGGAWKHGKTEKKEDAVKEEGAEKQKAGEER